MARYPTLMASVLLCACTAGPALADQNIETVIVTAERTPENELNVPLTVTAVSGNALHEHDVTNALDLQSLAPGLTVVGNLGSSDNAVFSIRGQNQPFGGADPGVQTYFAEVPFGAGGSGLYYDLDNVQVLEGPQGTLFGRSTTGGAILFEPKRPTGTFEASLDAKGGDFAYGALQGMINVPISGDMLDLRVAGEIERRNGYTQDLSFGIRTDNVDNEGIRAGLTFRPTPGVENYLVFDARWDRTHGTGDELTAVAPPTAPSYTALRTLAENAFIASGGTAGDGDAAFGAFYGGLLFAQGQQQALGPRATTSTIEPGFRRDDWGITDIAQWDVSPNLELRNIAAYRESRTQPSYDYDGSFIPVLEIVDSRTWQTNSAQLTEELHASGHSDDNVWRWIVGYYYEGDYPAGYSEIERQQFGGFTNAPLGDTVYQELNNGGTSNAIFAQVNYDASRWVNGLTLTAGGRYTWDRKVANEVDCSMAQTFGSCAFPVTAGPNATINQVAHFSAPTWNLSADYAVGDDTKLYVTYRRGYKSGGFNSGGLSQIFKPEFLTDIEVGVKHAGTLLGMPAMLNADWYYGWYNDIQKNDFAFGPFGPEVATFNAAKAAVEGFEISTDIRPTDGLDLNLFYSYTDASYGVFAFNSPPFVGNHAGDPFAYTPRDKFGVMRYAIPVDPTWGMPAFQVSYYYQSKVWFSDFADVEPDSSQGGHGLIDLRFDWNAICGSNLDGALFVDNVGDKLYKVGANPLEHLILTTSSMYGPPRMFGVELRYHVGE